MIVLVQERASVCRSRHRYYHVQQVDEVVHLRVVSFDIRRLGWLITMQTCRL